MLLLADDPLGLKLSVNRLVDFHAGAIVGRDHQRAVRQPGILLCDGLDPLFTPLHLVDAALPLQSGNCLPNLAMREMLDGLLQLRVFLAHDLIELHRFHAAILHLREDTASPHRFLLPGEASELSSTT